MQNGFVERFNRIYRESILDAYLFFELDQVRQLTAEWMEEYNERRPHEALNNLTPKEWKVKLSAVTNDQMDKENFVSGSRVYRHKNLENSSLRLSE